MMVVGWEQPLCATVAEIMLGGTGCGLLACRAIGGALREAPVSPGCPSPGEGLPSCRILNLTLCPF